jgi:hypothetical protein
MGSVLRDLWGIEFNKAQVVISSDKHGTASILGL